MTPPSLWDRLRSARVVQVGAVYLGGSWVVLQIIDTVQGLLNLPDWVGPTAVVLLMVGLLVVMATAWVQAMPQTTAAEEAGEVPTDWELAPGDALKSLSRGKLPHLTWGRALAGGAVALTLLIGVATFVAGRRGEGSSFLGARAGASVAAEGIAVLPFHMSGESMQVYQEGMVDLMSANLDGLSDYRAIDARTLLARWNRDIGETADVELERALQVAGGVGARYAVVGSGVDAGANVRFTAAIYDVADGARVGDGARVEGSQDEILALVDALTVEVVRSLLAGSGEASQAQALRVASLLTESVPALRHYLEGDAHFRRSRFDLARDAFQNALAEDSTFALAHWRLGDTYGWIESIGSPNSRESRRRAAAHADRLPERERTLLLVQTAIVNNTLGQEEMDMLRGYIDRYPDDPDGWFLLGEVGLHAWSGTGVTDAELEEALYRTVELDPTFGPYYQHALHWATGKGHEETYDSLMAAAEAAGDDPYRQEIMRMRWALFQGDEAERAAAADQLGSLERIDVARVDQVAVGLVDEELYRLEPLLPEDRLELRVRLYSQQGRLVEMVQLAEAAGGDALSEAVAQAAGWIQAGSVPDEIPDRLDRALGSPSPADGDAYGVRFDLDLAMGRTVDVDAMRDWVDEEMDEWLPGMAQLDDTVGIRQGELMFLDAIVLFASGRPEQAYEMITAVDTLTDLEPPVGVAASAALTAIEADEYEDAIRLLEGISRSDERTLAKFHLGRAYEAVGDRERALDAYRTFLSRTASADEQLGAVIHAREAVARLGG